jgi:hypothetical protein
MSMTPREVIRRTIRFEGADRIPLTLDDYGSDLVGIGMSPSPDARPRQGRDEWGCVWENIGVSNLGEVKQAALPDWDQWDRLKIPDIRDQPAEALRAGRAEPTAGLTCSKYSRPRIHRA